MALAFTRSAFIRAAALLVLASAGAAAQASERDRTAEAVKADLTKLAELERGWFEKNRSFSADLKALGFSAASGASVSMAYASARSWAANASHPSMAPLTCFIVVSAPAAGGSGDKPFCSENRRATADTKVAAVPPQRAPSETARTAPAPQKAAPVAAPPKAPATSPSTAPATTPARTEPARQVVQAPVTRAPAPAPSTQRRVTAPPRRRAVVEPAPMPTSVATATPPQGDASAAARAATRAATPSGDTGPAETLTVAQFQERLAQAANGLNEVLSARPPEITRDPYESTAEYEARRAQAMATFNRREADYYGKISKTYLVELPVKVVRYDPDREVAELTVEPVALPTARVLGATSGGVQLSVTCYTRPVFWCSPDGGMSYEPGDLWRVPRAKAREADVLRSPVSVLARFTLGHRDDARSPTVSLVAMDLVAKGNAIAKWDGTVR
ncbi:MAG: hypothetical protein K2X99_09280 [Gemmatimonadaceae bacterium]|nr:hypothetical protein [Gemmatimonadaceae bacterium]